MECCRQKVQHDTKEEHAIWALYVDRSLSRGGNKASLILIGSGEQKLEYGLRFKFLTSNNEVEDEALIHNMKLARDMGAHKLVAYNDSQLVVE